jgi:HEAT repeat protein
MMLRLFLVPLAVVAVSVMVFLLFGLIAGERKTARDYINEIRSGTEVRRWQAAYELANWLGSRTPSQLAEDNPTPELIRLYRDAGDRDPRIRRFLVLALGRLQDPAAVGLLVEVLDQEDAETVIYAAWSLGNIDAGEAVPGLVRLLEHPDPGVRKMAAHSLGSLAEPEAAAPLRRCLEDPEIDVTWNAALALGRLRDPASLPVLDRMTRRDYLDQFIGGDPARQEEIVINAIRALALLENEAARSRLESLSREDPSTRVRSAALDGLAGVDPPAPGDMAPP